MQVERSHAKHYVISQATILSSVGPSGLSAQSLDMSGNCLKRTDGLAPLTRLTFLCLAFNEILSLTGLSVLRSLVSLDVSHNHVSTLRGLDNLSVLTCLDASHNALVAPEEINLLRRCDICGAHACERMKTP
jgi:Leucine-rich repeat (LRR) protein